MPMQHLHSGKPQGYHVQNPTPSLFPEICSLQTKKQVRPSFPTFSQPQPVQQEILSVPLLKPVRGLIISPLSGHQRLQSRAHQHSMVFTSSQVFQSHTLITPTPVSFSLRRLWTILTHRLSLSSSQASLATGRRTMKAQLLRLPCPM